MLKGGEAPVCGECEERLVLVKDYGARGQVFMCAICGLYVEEIDLRDSKLSNF